MRCGPGGGRRVGGRFARGAKPVVAPAGAWQAAPHPCPSERLLSFKSSEKH